jgi:hypothetical protein
VIKDDVLGGINGGTGEVDADPIGDEYDGKKCCVQDG